MYINAILDKFACQAFYNNSLVRILRALVVNTGTARTKYDENNVHPSELTYFPVW